MIVFAITQRARDVLMDVSTDVWTRRLADVQKWKSGRTSERDVYKTSRPGRLKDVSTRTSLRRLGQTSIKTSRPRRLTDVWPRRLKDAWPRCLTDVSKWKSGRTSGPDVYNTSRPGRLQDVATRSSLRRLGQASVENSIPFKSVHSQPDSPG